MSKKANKNVFEFSEKHHYIQIDGVDYEIPQRTAALEKRLREHDMQRAELSEYECNIGILKILFGEDKALQMFPDGEETNLDKLDQCTLLSVKLYMYEYNKKREEKISTTVESLKPVFDAAKNAEKVMNMSTTRKFVAKK